MLGGRSRVAAPLTIVASGLVLVAASVVAVPAQAPSPTLERVRASGRLRLGYRTDARPFSYRDESGQPAGYSVALCQRLADAIQSHSGGTPLVTEWVAVTAEERFRAVEQERIDLLCGADTITLATRAQVSFSVPVFPGGIGALIRADGPARLRDVLTGRGQVFRPTWRASAVQVLQSRGLAAVQGTTGEKWLKERIGDLHVIANITTVSGYEAGVQGVADGKFDAFFGERAVLLDAARQPVRGRDLSVVDRLFTYEPLALAFRRGDEEFRLVVDRTLSQLYASGDMSAWYTKWFGEPDASTLAFFRWNTLSE